jgi:hypothetical protein
MGVQDKIIKLTREQAAERSQARVQLWAPASCIATGAEAPRTGAELCNALLRRC